MSKAVKERLPQLDIFRAMAICCVISVHASSFAAAEQGLDSAFFSFYNLMNIFFKVGTPSFIFLSSFVLFYNYFDKPVNRELVSKFYKKRLTYIILPYIIVSCCYYAVVAYDHGYFEVNSKLYELKSLGLKLLTGTAYTHLYFVFISIQFYILFPLLLALFRSFCHNKYLLAMIFPIGLALQWGFVFWNKYDLHLANKGSYALSYMSYYLLGAVVAIHFGKIKKWLSQDFKGMCTKLKRVTASLWVIWGVISFHHVQLWAFYRQGLHKVVLSPDSLWVTEIWYKYWSFLVSNTFWFELLWNLQNLLSAFILLRVAFVLHRKGSPKWVKPLVRLGELSFAVYLFHPAVLLVYRKIGILLHVAENPFVYFLFVIGGLLAAVFVSWIFVQFCFRRLPFVALFLGSVPSSLRKKKSGEVGVDPGMEKSVKANM